VEPEPPLAPVQPGERYGPLVHRTVHHGATLWLLGVVQFIFAMIVTQLAWTAPYSLAHNYISDLGAVHCGTIAGRYVCSPWHDVFDASVVLLGLLLIVGTFLITSAFPPRGLRRIGLGLLVLTGLGAIGVGLSPEDVNLTVHTLSAFVAFAGGNVALIVLGIVMFRDTRWSGYRAFTVLCGLVGFVALVLFAGHAYDWGGFFTSWGAGGIERTVVAPVLLWALLASIHLLRVPAYAKRVFPGATAT